MSHATSRLRVLGVFVAALVVVAGVLAARPHAQSAAPQQVTFTKDVAPILQRSCQTCHRAGQMAPMSLLTYEEVRPWARAIRQKVVTRAMPPWFVDRTVGIQKFKDDPSLSDAEIATIAAWVDAGAPRGNPADMPPPRKFAPSDVWALGEPDLIVTFPKGWVIPAKGAEWVGSFVSEPIKLPRERYIRATQIMPSLEARPGVHHAVLSLIDEDGQRMSGGSSLAGYNVGRQADIYPEGSGKPIKPGQRVSFGMHYQPFGKDAVDQTRIGLWFYPEDYVPKYVQKTAGPMPGTYDGDLDIPAGEDNARYDTYYRLDKPMLITSYQPHMHNRGKRQCLSAIYPNMREEVLSCVHFNFAWQLTYDYADDVQPLLPAGTVLHFTSWFDNSTKNPFNPDSRNWVGSGSKTTDEMARMRLNWYDLTEEEYKARWVQRYAQNRDN